MVMRYEPNKTDLGCPSTKLLQSIIVIGMPSKFVVVVYHKDVCCKSTLLKIHYLENK